MSRILRILGAFVCCSILSVVSQTASAATINVNIFEDIVADDSDCSLREAVESANADAAIGGCTAGDGADNIVLATGTYTLSITCEVNDAAAADSNTGCDDLDVYETLTVIGAGKDNTNITVVPDTISQNGTHSDFFRAFDIHTENLMADGIVSCEENTCSAGTVLTLQNLKINGAADSNGGAVRADSDAHCLYSKLVTDNVTFEDNSASRSGGAVYVNGQLVTNLTNFFDNIADDDGGAVYVNWNTSCVLTSSITSSTFRENIADDGNGGAVFSDTDTTLEIAGSNFTGNNADETGGAISAVSGSLSVTNSVITANGVPDEIFSTVTQSDLSPEFGGGIFGGNVDGINVRSLGGEFEPTTAELTLLISGTEISDNQSIISGAGVAVVAEFSPEFLFPFAQGRRDECKIYVVNTTIRDSNISNNSVAYPFFLPPAPAQAADVTSFPYLFSEQLGGGVLNAALGKMVIETTTIDSNEAALGAGVANLYDLSITKSTVSNNTALFPEFPSGGGGGGGVITASDFVYTVSFTGGGGLFNAGAADVVNSTFSGNKTDGPGAGILNYTDGLYSSIYLLLGDIVEEEGEGGFGLPDLEQGGEPGTILNNVTVAKNDIVPLEANIPQGVQTEISLPPVYLNNGGGIATLLGKITLSNTIVATNTDVVPLGDNLIPVSLAAEPVVTDFPTGSPTPEINPSELFGDFAPDCYAFPKDNLEPCSNNFLGACDFYQPVIVSDKHNLIGTNQGCTDFQPAENSNSDIVGSEGALVDPKLSPLAGNGGTTQNHLPQKTSPAIDSGNPAEVVAATTAPKACISSDQRNAARPQDGNLDGTSRCDIGAVEALVDCSATPGGAAVVDACGVCGGDGSTCSTIVCKEANIEATLLDLDGTAKKLNTLTKRLVRAIKKAGGGGAAVNKKLKKSTNLYLEAWNDIWTVPGVIKSDCTGGASSVLCTSVQTGSSVQEYEDAVKAIHALNESLIDTLDKLKGLRGKGLHSANDGALAHALTGSSSVPKTTVSCSK